MGDVTACSSVAQVGRPEPGSIDAAVLRAVVWVADDPEWQRLASCCADYCTRVGYEVVAVVAAETGGRWDDVARMVLTDGRAEVVVVASRDHLPRDRTPRIEAVADERRRVGWNQGPVRPQFLRR